MLGWPVDHSLSPAMHNAALASDGLDLAYLALPTPPEHLAQVVRALGATGFVGANVTVPHKQTVMGLCDTLTDEARRVGAVNTLAWRDGGLEGHNTDAVGLERALDEVDAGRSWAVLLGTGGAARAAAVALARRGTERLAVVGRRPEAAEDVATLARDCGVAEARWMDVEAPALATAVAAADLVVNATTLGMRGEALPAPLMALAPGQTAYDVVYAPPDTPFLQAATAAGAAAHHGLSMLVHQAAAGYEHWTGRAAPVEVMAAAAESALALAGEGG